MLFSTFKRTIGVVGIGGAGKTVFLTSLLSHLKYHDEKKLKLKTSSKKQAEIIKFKEIEAGMDLAFFELEKCRNTLLASKSWPDKTTDSSYFRCTFERTDWSWSNLDLTFLDVPGERFNDAVMFTGDGSFENWSDSVLKRISDDPNCENLAKEYLQVLEEEAEKESPDEKKITQTYKCTLARFMLDYGAFITPSVFALNTKGQQPNYNMNLDKETNIERIANAALVGRTKNNEFAPLPFHFREKHPLLTHLFSRFYQHYRSDVVEKLFKQLSQCDKLLVLVDIPGLLAANVGRYNDMAVILQHILSATVKEPGITSVMTDLLNGIMPASMRMSQLKNIAFIANKADMINFSQMDRLQELLQEFVKGKIKDYPHLKHDYFVCSALRSTEMRNQSLLGYPLYNDDGQKTRLPSPNDLMQHLKPSDLPNYWPDYWETDKYFYPEVWPHVPHKKTSPPNQNGLEAILQFIFEEK